MMQPYHTKSQVEADFQKVGSNAVVELLGWLERGRGIMWSPCWRQQWNFR